jgi:hypothetical protein
MLKNKNNFITNSDKLNTQWLDVYSFFYVILLLFNALDFTVH